MVYIDETEDGIIDMIDLENKLKIYANENRVKIGVFTAASNITGVLIDTNKITIMLHKYGTLAFWDYAAAAPYIDINMNPFVNTEE